ncbi:pilus assembly FimT family protein [Acinetobacter pragensis]|uniref:pilus assembly FimT family protein n=1 Tax=Acinetobacter pragensis TaxID=1806892 RepID=UPI003342C813
MQKAKGFTLIELVVVIAVTAIIAMMAAPSFAAMLAKQKLNSTTSSLMETLTQARNQAVLLRTTTTVNLNTEGANTALIYNWSPSENNTLESPVGLTSISFRRDGSASGITADTSFAICNSKSKTTKTFSLAVIGTVYATPNMDGTC